MNSERANMNAEKPLTHAQMLLELIKVRSVSTPEANSMGIMAPSQRVTDLRKRGYPISTRREVRADAFGYLHRVAVYFWDPQEKRQTELW